MFLQVSLGDALIMAGARLKVLDLSDNAFGPDGVKGIEKLLKSAACHSLQELRLNNCGMGIGGGKVGGVYDDAIIVEHNSRVIEGNTPFIFSIEGN